MPSISTTISPNFIKIEWKMAILYKMPILDEFITYCYYNNRMSHLGNYFRNCHHHKTNHHDIHCQNHNLLAWSHTFGLLCSIPSRYLLNCILELNIYIKVISRGWVGWIFHLSCGVSGFTTFVGSSFWYLYFLSSLKILALGSLFKIHTYIFELIWGLVPLKKLV